VSPVPEKNLSEATASFLRKLSAPRVVKNTDRGRTAGVPAGANEFEYDGKKVFMPMPGDKLIIEGNRKPVQTCVVTGRQFSPLKLPKPLRDRTRPDNLDAFVRWLKVRLGPEPIGTRYEYVIPYFSPLDPGIFLLIRKNGVTESVIGVHFDQEYKNWRIGGHYEPNESPDRVKQLESLILSAKMMSVFR
jgi:hypothetical protein